MQRGGQCDEPGQCEQAAGLPVQEGPVVQRPADAAEAVEAEQQGAGTQQQVQRVTAHRAEQQGSQRRRQHQAHQHALQGLVADMDTGDLVQRHQTQVAADRIVVLQPYQQLLALHLGDVDGKGKAAVGQGDTGAGVGHARRMAHPQQIVLQQVDVDPGNAGIVQLQQVGGGVLQRDIDPDCRAGSGQLQGTLGAGDEQVGVAVGEDVVQGQLTAGIDKGKVAARRCRAAGPASADQQAQAHQAAEQPCKSALHVIFVLSLANPWAYSAEGLCRVQGWPDDICQSSDSQRAEPISGRRAGDGQDSR